MTSAPFPLPLTPYERFMWRNDRPGYPVIWSLWATLRGEIDERLLDQALAETTAWHPLLSAIIAGRGRRARWTPGNTPVHRVAWTENSRAPIDPIDLSREPGLRVVAGKQGDEVGLVLHFNHSSSDGVGGIQFLGDLFSSYSQLVSGKSHAEPVRVLDSQSLATRARPSSGSLRQRFGHGSALSAWLAKALAFRPSVLAPDSDRSKRSAPDAEALYGLPELRLDGEQVAALRALAREAGASLNDVLLVEVLLAIRRWNADRGGGRRVRLMMPTNQRTADQDGLPAANIVGFEPIDQKVDDSSEWGELLAAVCRQTAAVKKLRQPSLMDDWIGVLAGSPRLMDAMLSLPSPLYTGIVSNLGAPADHFWSHLPQEDGCVVVGKARLEGVGFAPPVRPKSAISLGITAYGGHVSVTGKACPRTVGAAGLERFLALLGDQVQARIGERKTTLAGSTG